MKATIITLAIAGIMTLSNINTASAKQKTYTNSSFENNTKTIIAYTGENDQFLKQKSKCVIKYDENGNRIEKTIYKWNNQKWESVAKYNYSFSEDKQLQNLSYTQWNTNNNSWNDKTTQIWYMENSDSEFLVDK